jgi:Ras-associated and pleckstrin homology domains-containing protein 1
MLLDEFFTTGGQISMEGPLYLKSDSKKGWKRYHFVLRASGLYYYPKEKTRSSKDLLCLALFAGHDIYKGLGWKKKHKAPTDFTLALKCPKAPPNAKGVRSVKMLCVDDNETLEKWITAIRVAKYGRSLYDNHKGLLEELAREELDKLSSARSGSIGSIVSSVPSQCSNGSGGSGGGGNISLSGGSNGRVSRASSSSSSGCLSDDNNGFDSEFPTGTIKRKPTMKPNLPLTSMTRQLKEVGETTANALSPTSPEKGGTLTRRHSRKRSEESNGSGTLKRRPNAVGNVAAATHRGSIESMNSSQGTITPTPGTPIMLNGTAAALKEATHSLNNSPLSPLAGMPQSMTDSTFSLPPPPDDMGGSLSASMLSLNSLPPPPLPSELLGTDPMNGLSNSANHDVTGSQMSLISLPPPPPDVKPIVKIFNKITTPEKEKKPCIPASPIYETTTTAALASSPKLTAESIYGKSIKPSLKAPPYKAPPPYNNGAVSPMTPPAPPSATKSVSFADSPVLLRRKVSFDIDQVQPVVPLSPKRASSTCSSRDSSTSGAPPPPPRAEATRLSTSSVGSPPRRLADSQSNPPRDFLKDLQRVMRKVSTNFLLD